MYDFALVFSLRHARREPPMALTREQIASIATLARLDLTSSEVPVYQDSLSRILAFVGALDRAQTTDVAPMSHPLAGLSQRLRPGPSARRAARRPRAAGGGPAGRARVPGRKGPQGRRRRRPPAPRPPAPDRTGPRGPRGPRPRADRPAPPRP